MACEIFVDNKVEELLVITPSGRKLTIERAVLDGADSISSIPKSLVKNCLAKQFVNSPKEELGFCVRCFCLGIYCSG